MGVYLFVFHPYEVDTQTVAIFLLIGEFPRGEGIALADNALLDEHIASKDRIENVLVGIACSHLYVDGITVVWKHLGALIEPVVGGNGWTTVVH